MRHGRKGCGRTDKEKLRGASRRQHKKERRGVCVYPSWAVSMPLCIRPARVGCLPSAARMITAVDYSYKWRVFFGGGWDFALFFFQAEDGIRDPLWSRGLGDVYKRQHTHLAPVACVVSCSRLAAFLCRFARNLSARASSVFLLRVAAAL